MAGPGRVTIQSTQLQAAALGGMTSDIVNAMGLVSNQLAAIPPQNLESTFRSVHPELAFMGPVANAQGSVLPVTTPLGSNPAHSAPTRM